MFELNKKTMRNLFVGVAACIVLYWLLHETERAKSVYAVVSGILSPFVLGAGIAFILNVPMRAVEKLLGKMKNEQSRRAIAVVITLIGLLLVLSLVFWLLIPQVTKTVQLLIPQIYDFILRSEKTVNTFLADNPQVMDFLYNNLGLTGFDWGGVAQKLVNVLGEWISKITTGTFGAIGSVMSGLVNVVIGLVFAIYGLCQKENLARQGRKILYAILKERNADNIIRVLRLTNSTFSNFLSGQCIEVLILGAMFAVSMAIFRMPYIALVSVLIAITAFIPIVGAFIGCVFGAFFILVEDPLLAVWFVVMFLVLQQIEGNLIYPKVVGTSIGLPGMWVLVAVTVGGELMGIPGMFLMIPLSSVIYTLLREFVHKRLEKREIAPEKLTPQPPELRSHFKEKRAQNKEKRALRRISRGKK